MLEWKDIQAFTLANLWAKFSDSNYTTACNTYGRFIEERLAYALIEVMQMKRDAEFKELDGDEIVDHFETAISGLEGKVSGIETNIAALEDILNEFTDQVIGELLGHIDNQFAQLRNDLLTEGGKYTL